jgi:hypothetical protein
VYAGVCVCWVAGGVAVFPGCQAGVLHRVVASSVCAKHEAACRARRPAHAPQRNPASAPRRARNTPHLVTLPMATRLFMFGVLCTRLRKPSASRLCVCVCVCVRNAACDAGQGDAWSAQCPVCCVTIEGRSHVQGAPAAAPPPTHTHNDTRAHAHTRARTHARMHTHARTHARVHISSLTCARARATQTRPAPRTPRGCP